MNRRDFLLGTAAAAVVPLAAGVLAASPLPIIGYGTVSDVRIMSDWAELSLEQLRAAASAGKGANDCWLWGGAVDRNGYGRMLLNGVTVFAHRVAAAQEFGPLPLTVDGKPTVVLHTCDVPGCVNPRHLVVGTQAENMRDMVAKRRYQYGERHYAAKLTRHDVTRIRELLHDGVKQKSIAEQFAIDPAIISRINNGLVWKEHV